MPPSRRLTLAILAVLLSVTAMPCAADDESDAADRDAEKFQKQLKVDWTGINAQASQQLEGDRGVSRSIQISGQTTIIDEEGILGVTTQTEIISAVDESGKALVKPEEDRGSWRRLNQRHYNPPRWTTDRSPLGKPRQPEPHHFSVSIPLSDAPLPKKLQRLTVRIFLLTGKTTSADIPLEKSEEWTDLVPDLSVRLTKADVRIQAGGGGSSTMVEYQMQGKGDKVNQNFNGWVGGGHNPLPTAFISKMVLLDTGGNEHQIGGGIFSPNVGGSATFNTDGRTVTSMRLYVASDIREVAVPIEAKDLPVPGFGEK